MKRILGALALSLSLSACAAVQAPSAEEPPESAPSPVCQPVRLARHGIAGCVPAAATVVEAHDQQGSGGLIASIKRPSGETTFMLSRARSPSARAPFVVPSEPTDWARVDETREVEIDGYRGRTAEGLADARTRVAIRVAAVGDSFLFAEIRWPIEERLDPRMREAFLKAFRVEVPWRIHVSAEGRFSVALPAPAIRDERAETINGTRTRTVLSQLGGQEARAYAVGAFDITAPEGSTPDEAFSAGMRFLVEKQGAVVLKLKDDTMEGRPGREMIMSVNESAFMRMRVILAKGRTYVVAASTRHIEALSDPESTRFFESFQILGP